MRIPKQVLGIGTKGGRLPRGELRECVDCGEEIYLQRWQVECRYGLRCSKCSRKLGGQRLPKLVKHGSLTGCRHQWTGVFVCSECKGMLLEIVGNPSTCKLCGGSSVFHVGPFRGCKTCGQIRTLPAKVGDGEPVVIKSFTVIEMDEFLGGDNDKEAA